MAFYHVFFHPALLTHRQDTCQARWIESEITSVLKDACSKNRFSLARAGAESKKSRGGEGENKTRGIVWAAFGPVSRVVTWLQAKG